MLLLEKSINVLRKAIKMGEKEDIIYLISDGLSKYMLNVNPEEYCNEKGFNKIVIDSYILERYLQKCNNKK